MILWTVLFVEAQGYEITKNILYQENKSTIFSRTKVSAAQAKGPERLPFVISLLADQIEKGNVSIEYCPTTEMIGYYMSKPLQGHLFKKFKKAIMES
jgi:hypothetical protein